MAVVLIGKIIVQGDKKQAKNYFNAAIIDNAVRAYFREQKAGRA